MIAGRILKALLFALMLMVPAAAARAQSAPQGGILNVIELAKQNQAQRLEGSWALTVSPELPPRPPFRTYMTVSRGGALIGSDRTRPFGSPQHGAWVHLGGDELAAILIQDAFDAAGNFHGTLTGNDQFVSQAIADVRDAAGNLVGSRNATTVGERIKVD